MQGSHDLAAYRRRMAEEPIIEAPKQAPGPARKDVDYSQPAPPPLSADDQAWLRELLKTVPA